MRHAIDSLIKARLKEYGPGVAIGIAQAGTTLHHEGYGKASLEWHTPIQSDTVFRIASLTKQFTAMAILLLQKQGKLHIEDLLETHLPDCPPTWQRIQLKHLLNHTSGLANVTELSAFQARATQDLSLREMVELVQQTPLAFEPGTNYYYSNSGYHLLGLVIERMTDGGYEDFICEAIFQPLGMRHSYFQSTTPVIPKRASGYITKTETFAPAPYTSTVSSRSSGAIESTLEDLFTWNRALQDHTLIDPTTQALMFTPTQLSNGRSVEYGFGWAFSNYRGKTVTCHGGWSLGFRSLVARFLQDDLTIIMLANYKEFPIEHVALQIAAHYIDFPGLEHQTLPLDAIDHSKILGCYDLPGSYIEITMHKRRIVLRKGITETVLLPISESEFVSETNQDVTYRFVEEWNGLFLTLVIVHPLHFTIATRKMKSM